MSILVNTKSLSHEEWLSWRQRGIGGSDAGAICGLNPYKSPVEVWAEKTSDVPVEIPDNEAMRIGRDLEQYVAERFTEATGKKVRRRNAIIQSETHPFMIANVDRVVVGENALLECKTASPYNADKWEEGKCPESYEVQCHHYMAVTGVDTVYLACLIFGRKFVIVQIDRDEDLIQNLQGIEADFWNAYVVTKRMPPPDGSESTKEIICQMYPGGNDQSIDLPGYQDKMRRYDELSSYIDAMKAEREQIKQEIQLEMGDFETAFVGSRKITWKMPKQSYTVDEKKLKAEMPDIYEVYKKPKKLSRRFTVSKPKEEINE